MTTCGDLMRVINTFFPFACVAKKDNTGLIVGEPTWPVSRVLTAVDLTDAVIDEALRRDCQMILTHHHIMGKGAKKINPDTFEGRAVLRLIRSGIAFVACHNNLDFITNGTAGILMKAAGCRKMRPLYDGYAALATTPEEIAANSIDLHAGPDTVPGLTAGFGRVGELETPCTLGALIERLRGVVSGPVNVVGADDRPVARIACQVGAGKTADIDRCAALGVDVLITGDMSHDDRLYAAGRGLGVLDFCHYEAELPGVLSLTFLLRRALAGSTHEIPVLISEAAQPVRHVSMQEPVDPARIEMLLE